jgi:hypothetical protein
VWAEDKVLRLDIQVEQLNTASERSLERRWRTNGMEASVQIGQHRGASADARRFPGELSKHGRAVDSLHHEVTPAAPDDRRNREAGVPGNTHGFDLGCHVSLVAIASENEAIANVVDIRVALEALACPLSGRRLAGSDPPPRGLCSGYAPRRLYF